ncbi:MAG: beta strand repeat-containing protein, partial [Chloroflexota bacterium]
MQIASPQSAKAACGGIIYVNAASTAVSPTGCSWASAYKYLQDALANPTLTTGDQIWVAQGTYYPDEGGGNTNNNRYSTFTLVAGVEIYGGFNGTETLLSQRNSNPATNNTILSGDIDGTPLDKTNNAYHVVWVSNVTTSAVLDGFTITGGNTEGDGHFGGGVYIINASPTLRNLIITDNQSPTGGGGGMFIGTDPGETTSSPVLTNITFSNNTAERGGGLFNQNSNPVLTNVIFTGNIATNGAGGGINSQTANATDPPSLPTLINVTFNNNTAVGGGGMLNSNSHAVMTNVTFSGNAAIRRGGGLLNEDSNPVLTNVTFYNNTSADSTSYADPRGGGGMLNINSNPVLNNATFSANDSVLVGGDAMRNVNSNPQIRNSIFWDDVNDEIQSDGTSTVTISDSVVKGGITGTNIITTDPKLGPLANNGGFTQTMALGVGSSAINQGGTVVACAASDQRGVTRPQGAACDIGAYEFDGAITLTVASATGTYGDTVNLSATLVSYGTPLSGKTVNFTLNGISVGSAVTNAGGVATLNSVSLAGIHAGTYPGGTGSGIGASFAGDSIFVAGSDTDTLTVNPRPITVSAVTDSKTYDGTATSSAVPSITSGNLVGSDTAAWTQTFDNKNVGTNKTITPAGTISDGNGGNNYSITFQSVSTGVITAKTLTVSGITAANKVYDGNANATLNTSSASLVGVVSGDSVTLNTASAAGTFSDKNIGAGKTVTVSGLTLSGADAPNYSLTQPTTTADITAKTLTVSGITAANKVYDGNASATLNTSSASLVGVVSGDSVTLNTASAAGTFSDKNIGAGKTVTVSGLTLSGADASNYSLTQPTTTADITAKTLTVSGITAANKVYDGNANATLNTSSASLVGVVSGDSVTLNTASAAGTFSDKNIGAGKTVTVSGLTLSGADAPNYSLTQPTTTADITAKTLTVSGITAANKVYDGNATATLNTSSASLVGVVSGDSVTLNTASAAGTFSDKNAGAGKTVTVSGLTLSGADAPNYSLTQPTTTASITQRTLTVTATGVDKVYDGTVTATVTLSDDRLSGDVLSVNYGSASFSDPNAGSGKTVNVSGIAISGADAGNYSLASTTTTTTANIAQASQTITITTHAPANAANGSNFTVAATASSGLPVTYSSTTPAVCTNSGATFTMISGTGTCTVQYSQPGDSNYLPASDLTEDVTATEDPAITSADNVTFNVGETGTFTVTVMGNPLPSLSMAGALPTGITFNPATGVLSGIPAVGTGGTYNLVFTASNGIGPDAVQNFVLTVTSIARINVAIGGTPAGSYELTNGEERRLYYPVSGGPVKVESTNGVNIVSAIRLQSYANNTLYSFVETMGVPQGLLSYKYVFPTYNNTWAPLNSQIRVSNLETTPTTVRITIGSSVVWEQQMQGLEEQRLYFPVSGGPVIVESLDTSKKIVAAIRLQSYANNLLYSFSETMGIPDQMLSYRYYFPTYNNTWTPLNSQIRVSNLETTPTTVRITIGSSVVWEREMQGREEQRLY